MPDEVIKLKAVDEASGVIDRAAKNIGARLRAMKKESMESGESSLAKVLAGGPEQITESLFGLIGEGVQGLAVGFIGETLNKFTEGMVEARNQLAEGKTDAREMADQFVRSLPILGSFVATFENIRELITGEKLELEEQNEQTELTNQLYEAQLELAKKVREEREQYLTIIRNIRNEEENAGLVGIARQKELHRQQEEAANDAARIANKNTKDAYQKPLDAATKAATDWLNTTMGVRYTDLENRWQSLQDQIHSSPQLAQMYGNPSKSDEQKNLEKAYNDLQDKIKTAKKDLNNATASADSEYAGKVKANAELRKRLDSQSEYEVGIQRAEAARQAEIQIANVRAQTQAAAFTRNREFLKAQLVTIDNDYRQAMSNIFASTSKQVREESNPFEKLAIMARQGALAVASTMQWLENNRDAQHQEQIRQNDLAAHSAQVNDQLAKGKLESLQMEAAMGNVAAGIEAQRLKIQIEYNEKREEYNRILRDEAATVAQKAEAQRQLSGLDAREGLAMKLANMPSRGFQLNSFQEVGHTTGIAARAREENDPMRQLVIAAQKAQATQDEHTGFLRTIASSLTTGAASHAFPPRVLAGRGK